MAGIALIGSATLLLPKGLLDRILLIMVAFAAGSLLGGSFFHMLPAALETIGVSTTVFLLFTGGFTTFMLLEQFLHWHHCHRSSVHHREPAAVLILIADGVHNLIGGISVGSMFVMDVRLGITAWIAAAAHEIPQELGDFGVLVHSGWKKKTALLFNFLSGLTFLAGGLLAWAAGTHLHLNVSWMIPFGAGNFVYIAASDLIPQINRGSTLQKQLLHFTAFVVGLFLMYLLF